MSYYLEPPDAPACPECGWDLHDDDGSCSNPECRFVNDRMDGED